MAETTGSSANLSYVDGRGARGILGCIPPGLLLLTPDCPVFLYYVSPLQGELLPGVVFSNSVLTKAA